MSRFTGWPQAAFDVLLQLDGDPSTAERERLRRDRERLVRAPMIALMRDVADADVAYDDFFVWGFAKMLWPWQRQLAVARVQPGVEVSVGLSLDGLEVAATGWFGGGEPLQRYRAAVADDRSGPQLVTITRSLGKAGYAFHGDRLIRAPRGYPADHPRADLLRYRRLVAIRDLGDGAWLHTPDAVRRVLDEFGRLRPLTAWLGRHAFDS